MGKIALVHDFLFTFGGAERVLLALHHLFPEAPIYTMLAEPEVVKQHFSDATIITSSLQRSPFRQNPAWLIAAMPRAIEEFDLNQYDLVISSSGAFSHGVITGPDTVHLSYCHTPMRYAWDWHAEYLQERGVTSPLGLWFAQTVLSRIRTWDYVTSKRVDRWIANSKTVQARIEKYYHQKSEIIYPPVNTTFFDPSLVHTTSHKPYAVVASRLSPYKRIDLAIEACATNNLELHIVGSGNERSKLEQVAQKSGGLVIFEGSINEEEKRALLANAICFIFPAEDDFGIGPVEALSLGVPVLAFGKGGALETVQPGKNGLLFKEQTASSLSEQLAIFLKDGVSRSPAQIRQSAEPFSLEVFNQNIHRSIAHAAPNFRF